MKRPPVIYRPDPISETPPVEQAPAVLLLFGRVHRAHRSRGGHTLDCGGRFVRSGRAIEVTDAEVTGKESTRCQRCFG